MVKNSKIAQMNLDGGTLCLDFVNSVHDRRNEPMPDYLLNMQDLVAWAEKLKLIDRKKSKILETVAQRDPEQGKFFFTEAISLRELLYRIFFSISQDKKVEPLDLSLFNKQLQFYASMIRLEPNNGNYQKAWDLSEESLYHITAPIMDDAYELLLSDKLGRVKECLNCGWLFLDTTKNGKRKWCSMKSCGSSVKALNWYHRQKKSNALSC